MRNLSLRTKVFFLFLGAALGTVLPALVLIAQAVETRVYERATEELSRAGEALSSYWKLQDDALKENARRVAQERGVPEMLAAGDTVLLRSTLTREIEEGRVAIAADSLGVPLVGPALDTATLRKGKGWSLLPPGDGGGVPIRVAVWPVWAEAGIAEGDSAVAERDSAVVGVVGVGSRLDSSTIQNLRDVMGGTDVALVARDSLLAATLPDSLREVLRSANFAGFAGREGIWRRPGIPYLYSVSGLPTDGGGAAVVLFQPIAQELRVASGIRTSLVGIGFAALVLALLLASVVSRIVARPAQALAEAAAHLARGDYGSPLPPASGDEIGQLTRAFGEMRSEVAEREARLRSAQAELIHREKLAAMGRLVAQLSHEINNPIYNIQNCLEALARRGNPDDPNREFLDLAQEELARMAGLTRQLLDQSRPLSDAATPLDLNGVTRRVVTLARPELEARGIGVDLALDATLPRVVAHPDAIQQVLANLVANAVDAMPDGGTLRLSSRADEDAVEIAVEDTGIGIADEHLPHIFDAFYTTKPGIRGIGLGLFVSDGIIRGHRGRLLVKSRLETGSRFIVQLPRETLDPALARERAPVRDAGAAV